MPAQSYRIPDISLNDGTSIPQVGYGTWQIPADVAEVATRAALAAGYRHVDTAAIYRNEAEVGRAVARSGLPRDEIYVTTKLWNADQGYDETLRAFDVSMGELGLDYLDLYLIHWQCLQLGRYADTWRALVDLQRGGRVRSIGVSNFHEGALREVIDLTGVVPVLNQIELHPRLPQHHLRELHADLGIATESWSPLAQGQLIDDPTIRSIAAKHGRSTGQILVRWHVQQGLIVLPKSVTPSRIAENIEVFDFALDADDMAAMATLETGQRCGPDPDDFAYAGW